MSGVCRGRGCGERASLQGLGGPWGRGGGSGVGSGCGEGVVGGLGRRGCGHPAGNWDCGQASGAWDEGGNRRAPKCDGVGQCGKALQ